MIGTSMETLEITSRYFLGFSNVNISIDDVLGESYLPSMKFFDFAEGNMVSSRSAKLQDVFNQGFIELSNGDVHPLNSYAVNLLYYAYLHQKSFKVDNRSAFSFSCVEDRKQEGPHFVVHPAMTNLVLDRAYASIPLLGEGKSLGSNKIPINVDTPNTRLGFSSSILMGVSDLQSFWANMPDDFLRAVFRDMGRSVTLLDTDNYFALPFIEENLHHSMGLDFHIDSTYHRMLTDSENMVYPSRRYYLGTPLHSYIQGDLSKTVSHYEVDDLFMAVGKFMPEAVLNHYLGSWLQYNKAHAEEYPDRPYVPITLLMDDGNQYERLLNNDVVINKSVRISSRVIPDANEPYFYVKLNLIKIVK